MPKCSVKKCKNNTLTTLKKDGISYFRFPKNEIEREKWRKIIANERCEEFFKPNDSSVVCSCHFSENDMYYTKKGFRKVKKGVFPRIEIEISTTQFQDVSQDSVKDELSTSDDDDSEVEISTTQIQNVSPSSARNETSISNTSRVGDNSEVDILGRQPVPSMTTTTLALSTSTRKLAKPDGEKSLELQSSQSEERNTVEAIPQNEQITEIYLIDNCPPSPTSSVSSSTVDTPKTSYYKKSLMKCQKTIEMKNKLIQNLKKKNKRLIKRNLALKEIVFRLKKQTAR